jgi:membrane protease YdiL (CAAX protease family)
MPSNAWLLLLNLLLVTGLLLWATLLFDASPVLARLREGAGWLQWRPIPSDIPRRLGWALIAGVLLQRILLDPSSPLRLAPTAVLMLVSVLLFQGLAAAFVLQRLHHHRVPAEQALGLSRCPRPADLLWGLAGYCLCLPLVMLAGLFTRVLAESMGWELQSQAVIDSLGGVSSPAAWVLTFFVVGGLVPLLEEILFRGVLFAWIGQHIGVGKALLLQALIFAVIHQHAAGLLGLFALALLLGLLYLHTRRLWVCVAVHAIFNSFTLVNVLLIPTGAGL